MMRRFLPAICLSIFLASCGGNTNNHPVTLTTQKIEETQPSYVLDLQVPQVKGLLDAATQKTINDRLMAIATQQREQFLKDIKDVYVDPSLNQKSGLTMVFKAGTLSQDIISVVITLGPYTAGAAHPTIATIPFTYDSETKKEITFNDLFNTKAKYLERLSDLSITQLIAESKKKGTYYEAKEQMIRQGAAPKAENFSTFDIENGNLVLTFDPYQVGPYAEGEQTITLSREELTDVLSNLGRKILSDTAKSV